MHPAISRVCMTICATSAAIIFIVILVKVSDKDTATRLCSSLKLSSPPNSDYPCWDWKFDNEGPTCMFNLLFAASICLEIVIVIFFTSAFLKCLMPEFVVLSQRRLFCRFLSRYLSVILNFASTILSLSFVTFVLIHRNSNQSCYQFANLTNICIGKSKSCLLFVLMILGFVLSLLATFFSAWDARLWYVLRKEDRERERIYQHYMDYDAIQDVNNMG